VDVYLAIVSKREVRQYADRPVPEEVVRRILEAGRISGSGANKQPWRFLVVESPELVERLADTVFVPSTVQGAKLVIVVAVSGGGPTAFDAGRASQNMMLAAWGDGVGSCPNGMPDRAKAAAVLGLGDSEEPLIVLTFGYPAKGIDPERLTPEQWTARADRKPLEEIAPRL
jgi:nitroreductase